MPVQWSFDQKIACFHQDVSVIGGFSMAKLRLDFLVGVVGEKDAVFFFFLTKAVFGRCAIRNLLIGINCRNQMELS